MKVYELPLREMQTWGQEVQRSFWLNLCDWCRTNVGVEGVDWRLRSSGYDNEKRQEISPGVVILSGKDLANEAFTDMIMYAKLGLQLF